LWVRVPPRVYACNRRARATQTLAQPGADVRNEDREIRTPNLLIWSQTRYRCAISPVCNRTRRHTSDSNNKKRLSTTPLMQTNSPHWGLNPGPSVYKTDALPLSYRGAGPRILQNNRGGTKPSLGNNECASCGVRTHAQLPALDLKSNPLTTRANWHGSRGPCRQTLRRKDAAMRKT
jgi:hypothetical protein